MAAPNPAPCPPEPGSPYCSDPHCAYCKELRLAYEQLRRERLLDERGEREEPTLGKPIRAQAQQVQ
jgi:hypothetical protein